MVDVLMLASLGDKVLSDLLVLSQEFDVVKKGRTQSFFSDRTIYDATAFTQTNGNGDEIAYLGHVVVAPNGRLGFDPSVVLGGDVNGVSIHDVFAAEVAAHHDAGTIWANLLAGDDVVVGNGLGSYIRGYDGNDVLLDANPERSSSFEGGAGDDLIAIGGYSYCSGGSGEDKFAFVSRSTFAQIGDFEHGVDKIVFDRMVFPELGDRITRDNFHIGPSAAHVDDRIIAYAPNADEPDLFVVYFDPDGVGGAAQQTLAYVFGDHKLTFRDFGMVDAAKLMPDISKLFDMGAQPTAGPRIDHGFGVDHAAAAHDLTHHGLIQLV